MPDKIGPHLLGRRPSPPDERDWHLARFLSDNPLDAALEPLLKSHSSIATKNWATFITAYLKENVPTPAPPDPQPTPPAPPTPPDPTPPTPPAPPQPTGDVEWLDPDQPLDQGDQGTCVGHGCAQWGNTDPVEDHYSHTDAQHIYYEATIIDGTPDNPFVSGGGQQGSTVRSGCKALQNRGRLTAYAFASGTDEITAWLRDHGPVVVGTDWYNGMFSPDAKNFVKPTGGVAGGHCYLLHGVDAKGAVYKFLNSWGTSWGEGGHFYMKVTDFAKLLAGNGEAAAAVELPV